LTNNTATTNSHNGFDLEECDNCTLFNNTISRNAVFGCLLHDSTECKLVNNTVTHNSWIGIYLHYSDHCIVYLNRLGYNGDGNALDEGFSNSWDNGTHGNYWTDYSGSGPYTIPGLAGSADNHPFFWDYIPPDNTDPIINHPADIEYEEGSTGHSITWALFDEYPSKYEVYRDHNLIESRIWNGSNIVIDIDGLNAGVYNYTLVVYDKIGNSASDSVYVTVVSLVVTTTTSTTPTTPFDHTFLMASVLVTVTALVLILIIVFLHKKNKFILKSYEKS
jgi:parallel beta-helix repeat protein